MKSYIVYGLNGEILRTGHCPDRDVELQAGANEFVMEGIANGTTQKVEFDGLDEKGQPVNPRVVDKTPEEIEKENPTTLKIPKSQKLVYITNEQWQAVLKRLDDLETR